MRVRFGRRIDNGSESITVGAISTGFTVTRVLTREQRVPEGYEEECHHLFIDEDNNCCLWRLANFEDAVDAERLSYWRGEFKPIFLEEAR